MRVCEIVNAKHNTSVLHRSVQLFVKDGRAGESPKRRGPNPTNLSAESLSLLLKAFQSHVRLNQANSNTAHNERKTLANKVNLTMQPIYHTKTNNLLNGLFKRTKLQLITICSKAAEERRL